MKLNDQQIKKAKPKEKPYKLADGKGLYLLITPTGSKLWRLKYRVDGKEKTLSIGAYPAVTLSEAREQVEAARKQKASGIDPSQAKQQAKAERQAALLNTFQAIALQWHTANLHRWKPHNAERIIEQLKKDVFPHIGSKQLNDVSVAEVKAVLLRVIEQRKAPATAEKIRQWISAIYAYAAIMELTDRNPAFALRGTLEKGKTSHLLALPQTELETFYSRLMAADMAEQNRIAILLLMLLFPRSTEFRGGKWEEIDFTAKTWIIPAERMKHEKNKPKPPHTIPLSTWAIELLTELHSITGKTPYLFPSRTAQNGVISETTLNNIIKKMGYNGIATPHGFRSLASSVLNEKGFNPDAIERQLAHIPNDKIRAAYNRAEYMAERTEFMQWYSDFLQRHYKNAIQAA
ncbi:integrase arm-type DNA-binding domain-containing protein [Kingella kingae]|uniref:tyrosine-type recombinase/integrase n=1 Tax=Kingella kingae TaxID=504 RepID=UPI00254FCD1F|nr:integrase arm-type DNA-binding domain-containing protein [Kingella kingae]MDK4528589.1 integrase arm-type DNA-binding domain-containing protein [Kingella kingae]MDK4543142.1 integrase arm-type DNA-binding domain-containing protein [Kingella kingae]MDK4562668.1 integrase arm-type DNA-binding domain-containing protein [Kingella kingae]MDK4602885.1 integrase arm-type DNA-binding domain-containing protein [Kingella kingae]MDK4632740.1 integrase arm-type DNA-binding domain-containing protein [Ki